MKRRERERTALVELTNATTTLPLSIERKQEKKEKVKSGQDAYVCCVHMKL